MKYTILGFQQSKLLEEELKTDDALTLRVIKDMFSSASMEFKDYQGTRYMWVNYTYLLSQVPIIGSKRNLMYKIEDYKNKGLILSQLENIKNGQKGKFAYISPTIKLDALQEYDIVQIFHNPCAKFAQPLMKNLHNKDTSIKDTSIKDNKDIKEEVKPSTEIVKLDIEKTLNKYTNNKDLKDTLIQFLDMRKKQKDGITDYGIKKMLTKLTKISKNDAEKIEILDNSIMCSYKGVFPLKKEGVQNRNYRQDNAASKNPITESEGDRLSRRATEKYGTNLEDPECDF